MSEITETTERDLVTEVEEQISLLNKVNWSYYESIRGVVVPVPELLHRLVEEVKRQRGDNLKMNQAMGWLSDAADAAYNEDPDNERIHEIFNIVAQATGITRRLPDEYQRFDESSTAWTEP